MFVSALKPVINEPKSCVISVPELIVSVSTLPDKDEEATYVLVSVLVSVSMPLISTLTVPPEESVRVKVPLAKAKVELVLPDETVDQDSVPVPLVDRTCPLVPSAPGNVQVTLEDTEAGATKAT